MALQDDIAADQQAVEAAQAQLAEAQAKLAKDQAALDALQPHLSVIAELEAEAARFGDEALAAIRTRTAQLKALLGL